MTVKLAPLMTREGAAIPGEDHGGRGGWVEFERKRGVTRTTEGKGKKGGAGSKRGWPREPKGDGAQKRPGTQEFGWPLSRLHPGLGVEVAGLAVFCQGGMLLPG